MSELALTLADGRAVSFEVEETLDGPAFFLLSVRKCGSSLFNMIGQELARVNARRFVDVGGKFFAANIRVADWINDPALTRLLFPGNVYGGFRNMPIGMRTSALFRDGLKILLVRDPRDALVSEYFSVALSHQIPAPADGRDDVAAMLRDQRKIALESNIDAWVVRRAPAMANTMMPYAEWVGAPNTLVLRYEDVIFQKEILISAITRQFGWEADQVLIGEILGWADIRPAIEDPAAFVRKVTPGDHIAKLRPDTIATISRTLAQALESFFGYPRQA